MNVSICKSKKTGLPIANAAQRNLFDSSGFVPFQFALDARAVDGSPGQFDVAGMRTALMPCPNDPQRAMEMTLDTLCLVRLARSDWVITWPCCIGDLKLDSWKCADCTVTFRRKRDDGVIRATYSSPGKLEVSLPHMTMWLKHGLGWLNSRFCCDQDVLNPTPWAGKQCRCGLINK